MRVKIQICIMLFKHVRTHVQGFKVQELKVQEFMNLSPKIQNHRFKILAT